MLSPLINSMCKGMSILSSITVVNPNTDRAPYDTNAIKNKG